MPPARLVFASPILAALALATACTGDDAGTSESAGTSAAASTTSASDSATSTSGGASTSATEGGSGSATSASTASATGASSSTGSGSSTTGDASSGSSGGASSSTGGETGEPDACADLGDVDFGDCDAVLGVIFDGTSCKTLSGCGCEPHCDAIFKDSTACATGCAADGHCRLELFEGKGINKGPWDMGAFCDQVDVCGGELGALGDVLPGASCEAMAPYPCEGAVGCTRHVDYPITPEEWAQVCAASLLPGVSLVACTVWGP